ncbi:hypothetical protein [Thermotoga sp. KOL6]|uniref:hypothetical protein n=1 Tax=Thermotoga sp. KOL6 TaxID=126741 RepID=UPI000C76F5CE|nr:hypothetical protein [Thermotoga sp. KOL6]PLV60308.1 hypothetical protein AS005_03195 [Thermotoga sp. KOL6]
MKKSSKIILTIVLIFVAIVSVAFLYYRSFLTSPDYRASAVHYLFRVDDESYFVRIDDEKRMVFVVSFPKESYDPVRKETLFSERPLSDLEKMENLLGVKAERVFYSVMSKEEFQNLCRNILNTNCEDFPDFVKELSKRKMRFFDFIFVGSWVKKFGFNNLNRFALYKLLEKVSSYAIDIFGPPSITKKPVTIEVKGREYKRLYIDQEKLKVISGEMKN